MPTGDQYADDRRLSARQRLWATSRRDPPFELIPWGLDRAGITPGSTGAVLDLGCGNGRWLDALREREHAGRRVGGDLSHGMLAGLGTSCPRVQLDATALPFDDGAFDVVVAAHMLYHVDDRRQAVRECRRILRPGGRLVATTNGPNNIVELIEMVESAVGGGWRMVMPHHDFGMHNGAEQLSVAFDDVQKFDSPPGATVVTEVEVVVDYVASMDDFYADQVSIPWTQVVDDVRTAAARHIEAHGSMRLTSSVGAFVCR